MDELITCPYEKAHQIRRERIQYHLIKCKKSHPEMDLRICPYNATHHIQAEEEIDHISNCPDRRIIEIQRFRFNQPMPGQHGNLSNPQVYGSAFVPYEEREERPNMTSSASVVSGTSRSDAAAKRMNLLGESQGLATVYEPQPSANTTGNLPATGGSFQFLRRPIKVVSQFDMPPIVKPTPPPPQVRRTSPVPDRRTSPSPSQVRRTSPAPGNESPVHYRQSSPVLSRSGGASVRGTSPNFVGSERGSIMSSIPHAIKEETAPGAGGEDAASSMSQGATSSRSTLVGIGRGRGRGRPAAEPSVGTIERKFGDATLSSSVGIGRSTNISRLLGIKRPGLSSTNTSVIGIGRGRSAFTPVIKKVEKQDDDW